MRLLNTFILLLSFFWSWSQVEEPLIQSKKIAVKAQLVLDSIGVNSSYFKVLDLQNKPLADSLYTMDYNTAVLSLKLAALGFRLC